MYVRTLILVLLNDASSPALIEPGSPTLGAKKGFSAAQIS